MGTCSICCGREKTDEAPGPILDIAGKHPFGSAAGVLTPRSERNEESCEVDKAAIVTVPATAAKLLEEGSLRTIARGDECDLDQGNKGLIVESRSSGDNSLQVVGGQDGEKRQDRSEPSLVPSRVVAGAAVHRLRPSVATWCQSLPSTTPTVMSEQAVRQNPAQASGEGSSLAKRMDCSPQQVPLRPDIIQSAQQSAPRAMRLLPSVGTWLQRPPSTGDVAMEAAQPVSEMERGQMEEADAGSSSSVRPTKEPAGVAVLGPAVVSSMPEGKPLTPRGQARNAQDMEVRWGLDPDLQRLLAERKAMEDAGERVHAIDEAIRLRREALMNNQASSVKDGALAAILTKQRSKEDGAGTLDQDPALQRSGTRSTSVLDTELANHLARQRAKEDGDESLTPPLTPPSSVTPVQSMQVVDAKLADRLARQRAKEDGDEAGAATLEATAVNASGRATQVLDAKLAERLARQRAKEEGEASGDVSIERSDTVSRSSTQVVDSKLAEHLARQRAKEDNL